MKIIVNMPDREGENNPEVEMFIDDPDGRDEILEIIRRHVDHTKTIYHNL